MLRTYSRDLIVSVKEMVVERGWSIMEVAQKLRIDPDDVQAIMEVVRQVLS
jgi:ribosome-binding protein aMBF1 (putative translation factor)